MKHAALLVALAGCLNVPAFSGDGGTDAPPDGAPLGTASVTVRTRDGTAMPVSGATVVSEPYGGGADTASTTTTGSDGVAQFPASGTTRVYVADLQDNPPTLVVFEDVAPGDALQVGAPRKIALTPTLSGTPMSALFPTAASVSAYLPCGYASTPYAANGTATAAGDLSCGDAPSPMLFYYEDATGALVGAQTGHWSPDSTMFTFVADAAAPTSLTTQLSEPPLDTAITAYAWAFGDGKRLAARRYALQNASVASVPWRGYDDRIEYAEYLAPTGRFGMMVRDRAVPEPTIVTLSMAHADLAPWLAKPLVPGADTITWTLAEGRSDYGATQLVVVDVYNLDTAHAVRWIAPGRAIATGAEGTESLAMPIPDDLFPGFGFDGSTHGTAAARLVHAAQGAVTDEATIYDMLRASADLDTAYAEYTNAPGITRAAVSGVLGDSDAARYLP